MPDFFGQGNYPGPTSFPGTMEYGYVPDDQPRRRRYYLRGGRRWALTLMILFFVR